MRIHPDLKPLIEAARKNGFNVIPDGRSKHMKIVYGKTHGAKAGQRVMADDGKPLILAGTPSEFRERDQVATRLVRSDVIKWEQVPWRNEKKKGQRPDSNGRGSRLTDPDVQEAKLKAIREKSERNAEATAVLRGRMEPIIAKLGGWKDHYRQKVGFTASDVADVALTWAQRRGRVELPKDATQENVRASARVLRNPGSTLGEKWLPFWRLFLDELERGGEPDTRFMELYKEMKGIPTEVLNPAAMPPPPGERWAVDTAQRRMGETMEEFIARTRPEIVRDAIEGVHVDRVPIFGPATLPTLALRAVALMAQGHEGDLEEVLEVGQKILDLEMRQ